MSRARLALALLLAGCAGDGAPVPGPPTPCTAASAVAATVVAMVANTMNPDCIQVARGASVEFVNQDTILHTATDQAAAPSFDIPIPGGSAAMTPPLGGPATVEVACIYHPAMRVTIFVP